MDGGANDNESSGDDDDEVHFPCGWDLRRVTIPIPRWDVRRNEIMEWGENLKEGTLQYISEIRRFYFTNYNCGVLQVFEFVANATRSLLQEFNDDEDIMMALECSSMRANEDEETIVMHCSQRLLDNERFMLKMNRRDSRNFKFASRRLRNDPKTVLAAISSGTDTRVEPLKYATDDLKGSRPFMLQAVARAPECLSYAKETLRDDYFLVSKAVQEYPAAIKHASPRLRDNIQIALYAVTKIGHVLEYVSPRLQNDFSVAWAAVCKDGGALHMSHHGRAIEYASEPLRDNKQLALEAVTDDGYALKFVSPRLQNDFTVALAAVRENGRAIQYASEPLRDNKQVALEAVTNSGNALEFVSPRHQNDFTVALAAVRENGRAIQYASEPLRDNKQVALEAVTNSGNALEFVSPRHQNDFTVALAAVRAVPNSAFFNNGRALEYVSEPLRKYIEIRTSSNLRELRLPQTDVLVNQEKTPSSIFPYLFDRVGNSVQDKRLTIYYLLKNRIDLIPSNMDLTTLSSDDTKCKKRKRCEETK